MSSGQQVLSITVEFVAGIIVGVIIGLFFDNLFDSRPICLIICMVIAIIATFRSIWEKYNGTQSVRSIQNRDNIKS